VTVPGFRRRRGRLRILPAAPQPPPRRLPARPARAAGHEPGRREADAPRCCGGDGCGGGGGGGRRGGRDSGVADSVPAPGVPGDEW
jgi:hypothetical protein